MVTRIAQLSEILENDFGTDEQAYGQSQSNPLAGFEFWSGASGRCYVHSVFSLQSCPELPQANFMLVLRHEDGSRDVRHVGRTTSRSPSLNLAHIRQLGAELAANEVHVHFLGTDERCRSLIAFDLESAASVGNAHHASQIN